MARKALEIKNEVEEMIRSASYDVRFFKGNVEKLKIFIDHFLNRQEKFNPGTKQKTLVGFFRTANRDEQWEMAILILQSGVVLTQADIEYSFNLSVSNGVAEMVTILIKTYKANPNMTFPAGEPPIMNAIANCVLKINNIQKNLASRESKEDGEKIENERRKFIETISILIECGADVNKIDRRDNSQSLFYAIADEEYTIAQLLIEKNADVNASFKTSDGEICNPFKKAVKIKNFPLIKLLIDSRRLKVDPKSKEARFALMITMENRDFDVVRFLLERGVYQNGERMIENALPLVMAAGVADIEIMKLLFQYGAKVNAKATTNENEDVTALHVASQLGHAECVKLLLANGADEEIQSINGNTPLILAAQKGHAAVIEEFLAARKKINLEAQNHDNATALILATRCGDEDCVRLLVENGAKIEVYSSDEFTPLMLAAKYGYVKILEILIQKGADLNRKSKHDYTAFDFACHYEQIPCMKLLLESGFKIEGINNNTLLNSMFSESEELDQLLTPMWDRLPYDRHLLRFIKNCNENNLGLVKKYLDKNDVNKKVKPLTEVLEINDVEVNLVKGFELFGAIKMPVYLWADRSSKKEIMFLILENKYRHAYPSIDQNHIARFLEGLFEVIDNFKFTKDADLCIKLTKDNKNYDISISEATIIELINKPEVQDILRIEEKGERNRQFGNIIWGYSNEAKELKEEQETNDLKSQIINFLYQSIKEIEINSNKITHLLDRIKLEGLKIDSKNIVALQDSSKKIAEDLKSKFEALKKEAVWNKVGLNIKEALAKKLEELQSVFKSYQEQDVAQKILALNQKILAEQEKNADLNAAKPGKKVEKLSRKKENRKQERENLASIRSEQNSMKPKPPLIEEPSKDAAERKRNQEEESQATSLSLDSSSTSQEITLRDEATLMALASERDKLNKQPSQVVCQREAFQIPNITEQFPNLTDSIRVEEGVFHYPQKPQEYSLDTMLGRLSDRLESKEARDKLSADLKATSETKTHIETLILCEALEGRFGKFFDKRQKLQEDWPYHIRLVLFKNEREIYQQYSKIQLIGFFKEIIKKLDNISEKELMKKGHKLSLQSIDTQEGFLKGLMKFSTSNNDLKVAIEMIDLAKSNLARIEEYIISNPKNTDNIHLKEAVGRNFGRIGTYLHQLRFLDYNTFLRINRSVGFTIPIAAQYRHDDVLWEKEAQEWIANVRAKKKEKEAQVAAKGLGSKPIDKKAAQPILMAFDAVKDKLVQENPVKGEWTAADAGDSKSTEKSDKKRRRKRGNKKK